MFKSVAIRVTGRVQHVGFRHFAIQKADIHGIRGFVRNEADGSVYIEAQGEKEALDAYVLLIGKGPSWSRVDQVQISKLPLGDYTNFSVHY